jgi:hypothetical protein
MSFELVNKNSHVFRMESEQVSVGKSSMTLGKYVYEQLKPYVEVYLDIENNKVGLKQSENPMTGFKIHVGDNKKDGSNTTSISGTFMKRLQKGQYKTREEDGLIVFDCEVTREV